jgi:hypothetical protein
MCVKAALLILVSLAAHSGAAFACSIEEDRRPAEVQLDEWARESYARAEALVEVVAVEGSRRHRPGVVRVVRVLKGPIRPGRLLSLRSVEPSLCGAGGFRSGSRGLILIARGRERLEFQGYLPADYLTRLDRLGCGPSATLRDGPEARAHVALRCCRRAPLRSGRPRDPNDERHGEMEEGSDAHVPGVTAPEGEPGEDQRNGEHARQ